MKNIFTFVKKNNMENKHLGIKLKEVMKEKRLKMIEVVKLLNRSHWYIHQRFNDGNFTTKEVELLNNNGWL